MNTETLTIPELLQLTNGHPPHREDWTRDMLPEGTRPLCKEEKISIGDEFISWNCRDWHKIEDSPVISVPLCHHRTHRPAPPKPAEEVAEAQSKWTYAGYRAALHLDGKLFALVTPDGNAALSREASKEMLGFLNGEHYAEQIADLRTRLATSEQEVSRLTRERDEARDGYNHLVEDGNEKQEVIEAAKAQLATLRGELEEVITARDSFRAFIEGHGFRNIDDFAKYGVDYSREQGVNFESIGLRKNERIAELEKQLAAHTWTPVSERMPEYNESGTPKLVEWRNKDSVMLKFTTHNPPNGFTHWRYFEPIPTLPESESRKEFEAFVQKEHAWPLDRSGDGYLAVSTHCAWLAWQASREGAKS